ncbi:FtsB family cell division protein [Paenibacillus sp. y28]|uniref:FtsB family cell division protein n=1 Tax=Paenibacillus sp. y28 TaxID=3129110 RepID=UPI00301AB4D3
MQAQKNTGSQRRIRMVLLIVAGVLVWAGCTFWNQMGRLQAKSDQIDELQGKLDDMKQQNDQYKLEVARLEDPEFIEQKLRKEYNYTRAGETMFNTLR